MPYLVRVTCPKCFRDYRYSSDSDDQSCPFSDCWLVEEEFGEDDK